LLALLVKPQKASDHHTVMIVLPGEPLSLACPDVLTAPLERSLIADHQCVQHVKPVNSVLLELSRASHVGPDHILKLDQ